MIDTPRSIDFGSFDDGLTLALARLFLLLATRLNYEDQDCPSVRRHLNDSFLEGGFPCIVP